jgi:hypothetical protein
MGDARGHRAEHMAVRDPLCIGIEDASYTAHDVSVDKATDGSCARSLGNDGKVLHCATPVTPCVLQSYGHALRLSCRASVVPVGAGTTAAHRWLCTVLHCNAHGAARRVS